VIRRRFQDNSIVQDKPVNNALEEVREFHRRIGARDCSSPVLLPCQPHDAETLSTQLHDLAISCRQMTQTAGDLPSRLSLALEEMAEWVDAHAAGDLVAAADAWGDRMYVLLGDAVATGLPGPAIFDEVHKSNMSKDQGATTKAGKGKKSERFVPPDLARILGLQE
jgi:predicted HAD superfamily Cof-like phosphohydrolase